MTNPAASLTQLHLRNPCQIFSRGSDLSCWKSHAQTWTRKPFPICPVQVLLPLTYAAHGGWLFFALVKCGLETQPKTGAARPKWLSTTFSESGPEDFTSGFIDLRLFCPKGFGQFSTWMSLACSNITDGKKAQCLPPHRVAGGTHGDSLCTYIRGETWKLNSILSHLSHIRLLSRQTLDT